MIKVSNGVGKLKNAILNVFRAALNLVVPRDRTLSDILEFGAGDLRRLLPKAKVVGEPDAYPIFDYGNQAVRKIVWALKYRGDREVLRLAAECIYEEMAETAPDIALFEGAEKIIVVPIPASPKRKMERGFGQCELLLKEMEKIAGGGLHFRYDILKKIRDTGRQTELKREERLLNVEGSMAATDLSPGSVVFVVDDVYTTGATFDEARRALLAAGAKRVYGFFLAH